MRRSEEGYEQTELDVAQRHRPAVARLQPPRVQVQFPSVEPVEAYALGPALSHLRTPSAQHRTDTREELARTERFGHIVVSTQLEPHHAVGLLPTTGEHDDGDSGLIAHPARKPHTVLAGQPQVQDEKVHHFASEQLLHGVPVADRRDRLSPGGRLAVFLRISGFNQRTAWSPPPLIS